MRRFWPTARGREEAEEFRNKYPSLTLTIHPDGVRAVVLGPMRILDDVGYTVTLQVAPEYPEVLPTMHCNPAEIPWHPDRHVNHATGIACLCVRSETRLHWPLGSSLAAFMERLVEPFLVGQLYFDAHGCWPPTGQRSHGRDGILEAYSELLRGFGNPSAESIRRVMKLLVRKADPKGHEICPCGSNLPLRKCHGEAMRYLRSLVSPRDAQADLLDAF